MPSAETFSVPPIGDFVRRYLDASVVSVDPFARDKRWATHTIARGVKADLVLIDPPYSPRQIKECYDAIGLKMQQDDALRAKFMKRLRKRCGN